jgi:hypothetical protein
MLSTDQVNEKLTVSAASEWDLDSEQDFNKGTFENTTITKIGSNVSLQLESKSKWFNKLPVDVPKGRITQMVNILGTQET